MADDWAKGAAESPMDAVPREYLHGISLAHMTRMATENLPAGVRKWIVDRVKSERPYILPMGPKLRKGLRHERKALAGGYYQLLSGHAATGDCLHKIRKLSSDKCWWCGQDERQTRHYQLVNCAAWEPRIKELWKDVSYLCGWKHLRALRMALLIILLKGH